MSFTGLNLRLQCLPLGLLWGMVASAFHIYFLFEVNPPYNVAIVRWPLILLMSMTMVGTCPIATLLGSVLLKRELSSIRWIVHWVMTGVVSCIGGVAIFYLVLALWVVAQGSYPADPVERVGYAGFTILVGMIGWFGLSLVFGIAIAIGSTVVALVSAPLSLLGRRLILRRTRVAEPAGGASQTPP